jgi:hypothetical protein
MSAERLYLKHSRGKAMGTEDERVKERLIATDSDFTRKSRA